MARTYALRLFVDRKRKLSNKLTKAQAKIFRKAALHLQNYLTEEYRLPRT